MNQFQKIVVIGQGYVGLPLAIAAAESGWNVFGIDILSLGNIKPSNIFLILRFLQSWNIF